MKALLSVSALAVCAAFSTGCQQQKPGHAEVNFRHNKDGQGTPVATFAQDSITQEELKERFLEMNPFARARYQTPEEKKQFVEGMARFELLAKEALAQGLQNDPEVVEQAKKVMVQKLVQKEFDEKPTPVSDAEVKDYYEKHKTDFVKPEMVRLSHIFIAAPEGDASRAEKQKKAEELVKQARALQPLDYNAFGKLVAENSDEARTKSLRGDMRYLSEEELSQQYGPEVATAQKSLQQVGQVSDVVATPKGFHILKLQGRQAALNLGVDQVKTQIQSRLIYERRTENFNKFIEDLKKKYSYSLNDAAVAKVEVDMNAPAKEAKGPPPGFIQPVQTAPVK